MGAFGAMVGARLLDGKRISANVNLWIHAPRAIKEVADRSGYTAIIESAGARLLSDTCPAISRAVPKGAKVVATNSAKQAHYLPAIVLGTRSNATAGVRRNKPKAEAAL